MSKKTVAAFFFYLCLVTGLSATATAQNDDKYGKVYFLGATQRQYNDMARKFLRRRDRGDTATRFGDAGWGSIVTCNVFVDSTFICELNQLRYFSCEVPAGTHRFSMQEYGKELNGAYPKTIFTVEPGKIYYIFMCFNWGTAIQRSIFPNRNNQNELKEMYCRQLPEERAQMLFPSMREDKGCRETGSGHQDSKGGTSNK